MSYDIYLNDPETGEALHTETPHGFCGGTYIIGGTTKAWLNVTYNYSRRYKAAFGDDEGIYILNGMTGRDSVPVLSAAISKLGDDVAEDYWEPTEGNAKVALLHLRTLAQMLPHGVWSVS